MELPYYVAEFDETNPNQGLRCMSVVDIPAILSKYVAFSNTATQLEYAINETRQIIAGPALIPDIPIERYNKEMGRHYMVIPRKVIDKVIEYYSLNQRQNNVNLMHMPNSEMKNVAMVESFQIDRERGINPPKGFDYLIDGSWWVGYKFFDKKQYDILKTKYRGFSIEGFLDFTYGGTIEKSDADEILKQLTEIEEFLKKHGK